ncbi:sulfurtransferase [Lignipirellula cremea]|nr:sulfurtransferase [Lignipirellula cremea]
MLRLALLGIAFAGACWQATPAIAAAPLAEGAILIQADQLKAKLVEAKVRLVDVRATDEYQKAHLPGATGVDLAAWKTKALAKDGLHDVEFWSQAVRSLGINADSTVVVYGGGITDAARVWWLLKYVGVNQVLLLDGGLPAWTRAGFPLSAQKTEPAASTFTAKFQADRLAEMSDLLKARDSGDWQIMDARSPGEFTGAKLAGSRAGRMPGALHLEWSDLLAEDGRFLDREALRLLLAEQGFQPDATIVTHCYSGGRASVNALALELAGYPQVKNYYCGWSEYSAAPEAPVVTGDKEPVNKDRQ